MAEELLDKSDVCPVLQHLSRTGVTEQVTASFSSQIGKFHVFGDDIREMIRGDGIAKS